ncbi:MAG: hypothetical protein Q7V63_07475 [Gammaproteobacteria bacterium]|nr:hypothetical protein [Gammaproteobacteria bacterium]
MDKIKELKAIVEHSNYTTSDLLRANILDGASICVARAQEAVQQFRDENLDIEAKISKFVDGIETMLNTASDAIEEGHVEKARHMLTNRLESWLRYNGLCPITREEMEGSGLEPN